MTYSDNPLVEGFLLHLDGVRPSGDQWVARCPCRNDDKSPTLSVAEGRDGRVLVRCHRGGSPCSLEQICEAAQVDLKDLHPPRPEGGSTFVEGKLTNVYSYFDVDGELVMQVLRFMQPDGRKEFRQRVPDSLSDTGWKYSTQHLVERPLYRLPEIVNAMASGRVIYVAEGEKDVDALWEAGFAATCNPMGADDGKGSKWKANMTRVLADQRVVVIADNDEPGRVHADYVATQLSRNGATVKVKCCPAPHKDAFDLLKAGLTVTDLVEIKTYEPDPFWTAAQAIANLAETDMTVCEKTERARDFLEMAGIFGTDTEDPTPQPAAGRLISWPDFINEVSSDAYDWLIEGMLERGERMMVVAAEGAGKTTLARQVAILAGAGIHPFTYHEINPIRTLFVDLENPEKIIRRQSRKILDAIKYHYSKREIHSHLFTKPNGLNIFNEHDRRLLEQQIETVQPDLLALGPIYKSFIDPGGKTSTALVTEAAMYFDHLRVTYDIALWLEHHAPLGNALTGRDLRPADSAVWMRWPEFGFALALDPTSEIREYEFKQWRGPRDLRSWPARLRRGSLFPFEVTEWKDVD